MAEEVLNQDQLEQQVPQQEEPPKKLSVGEFASKIKSKYPEYKDIDDNELTSKMLSKFPIYKDQVDFSEKKNDGQPLKLGGQELKTSGTPPTPSPSPSSLQEGQEKTSWQTSALNPAFAVQEAQKQKETQEYPLPYKSAPAIAPKAKAPQRQSVAQPSKKDDGIWSSLKNFGEGVADYGKYFYNNIMEGVGEVSSASSDVMMNILTKVLPDEAIGGTGTPEQNREKALKSWRENVEPTVRTATKQIAGAKISSEREKQFNDNFVLSAIGGLGKMIPAMVAPEGTGFILQAYDGGLQSVNNSEVGRKLPESTKTIYGTANGIVMGALMKLQLDKIFGKQSDKVASKITSDVLNDLLKNTEGAITKDAFEVAVNDATKSLKNKIVKAGGDITKAGITGTIFGGATAATDITSREILNRTTKKEVFEPTSWGDAWSEILKSGASMGIGGLVLGGIHVPFSETRNYIKDKVLEAKTEGDIVKLKNEIVSQVNDGKVPAADAQKIMDIVDEYASINKSIPADVQNRGHVVDKIKQSNDLKTEANNTLESAVDLHPAFQAEKVEEAQAMSRVADNIDNSISNKPIYKIGDREVDRNTFEQFVKNNDATTQDIDLYVEGDDAMSAELEKIGGVSKIADEEAGIPEHTIKTKTNDKENITGLPSKVGEGEEPITTKPIKGTGTEEVSTGRVLQAPGIEGEGQGVGEKVGEEVVSKLKDIESTAKELEGKDISKLIKDLGIESNWDMVGEGDLFDNKSPEYRYTQRLLPEWNRANLKGEINPNSKLTYDIVKGRFGGIDNKEVVEAKDENGRVVGVIKLSSSGGIEHIAVAPEFRGKGVADKLLEKLKENNPNLDLSKTKLKSKGFEKAFAKNIISEAYYKAKADGSNPELVKAVEDLIGKKTEVEPPKQERAVEGIEGEVVSTEADGFDYVRNKYKERESGGKDLSEKEATILNKNLNSLIDRAEKENKVERNNLKQATWKTNDGYVISEFYENGKGGTRIITPKGEEINIFDKKYKGESGQKISYFSKAHEAKAELPKQKGEGVGEVKAKTPIEGSLYTSEVGGAKSNRIYLADESVAKSYGEEGAPIVKYNYKLDNPLVVEKDADFDIVKKIIDNYRKKNPNADFHPDITEHVNSELEKMGYDGLVIKNESLQTEKGYNEIGGTYGEPQTIVFDRKNVSKELPQQKSVRERVEFEKVLPQKVKKDALDNVINEGTDYDLDKQRNPNKKSYAKRNDEVKNDHAEALMYALYNKLIDENNINIKRNAYGLAILGKDRIGAEEKLIDGGFQSDIEKGYATPNQVKDILESYGLKVPKDILDKVESKLPQQKGEGVGEIEKKPFSIDNKEDFYHGSYNKREGKLRTNTAEQFGEAIYFTTSKEEAEGSYPNVTKVKLNIENPIYAGEGKWNEVERLALEKENANKERDEDGNIINEVTDIADIRNSNNISDAAKELGYDAIILRGEGNHQNETAVLDPSKIIYPEDILETPKKEEAKIKGIDEKEIVRLAKPITDRMVEIEREFENQGYTIDTTFDNEIQILDKDGEQVEFDDLPNELKDITLEYQSATAKLGDISDVAREKALAESRKVVETEAEVIEPEKVALPEQSQEQVNQQELKETENLLNDGDKIRKEGKYVKDGVEYVRNEKGLGIKSEEGGSVRFTSEPGGGGVSVPFTYKLIESETLQPSHQDGLRNPNHFIWEAQPKNRNDEGSIQAEEGFANKPRFTEMGENTNAYSGAPIVNERGEVIQGNNRSAGLKKGYQRGIETYKKSLAENAEKFGFTKEQVEGMKNPVLVREVAVSDSGAIELGNYDVKDLESGGKRRLDPVAITRRMPFELKGRISDLLFKGEGTLNQAIRDNTKRLMELINPFLNQAQRNTIFKDGELTQDGAKDLETVAQHFLFDGGDTALPELHDNLSHTQKEGLRKSLPHIFSTGIEKSIVPEVQEAIIALNDFAASKAGSFDNWLAQSDMFNNGMTPKDKYSPTAIKIAEILNDAKNQKEITTQFGKYAELVNDKPATMFDEATKGISKKEGIKQIFKTEYDESKRPAISEGGGKEIPTQEEPLPQPSTEPSAAKPAKPTTKAAAETAKPKPTEAKPELPEQSALDKAREARKAAKEKLNAIRKGLGITPDPKKEAEALFEYHKALVTEAKEYIKAGIETVEEWAKEVGEKVNVALKSAWDEATGKVPPTEKAEDITYTSSDIESRVSGVKKAITTPLREALGLPAVELPKMGTDIEELQQAKQRIDSGDVDPISMIDDILKNDRGYKNEKEVFDMQYYAHQLDAKDRELSREMSEADNDIDKAEIANRKQLLSDEIDKQTEAARKAGNKWGKIGYSMQPVIDTEFSMSRERNLIKEAYAGEVPQQVKEKIEIIAKERDEAIAQKIKIEKDLADLKAKKEIEKKQKEVDAEQKGKSKKTREDFIKERQSIVDKIKKKWRDAKGGGTMYSSAIPIPIEKVKQLAAISPEVGELIKSHVEEGVSKLSDIVDNIHDLLKDQIDGLTKKDVLDLIGGKYSISKERSEAAKKVAEIRAEAKKLLKENPTPSEKMQSEIDRLNKKADNIEAKLREGVVIKEKESELNPYNNSEWIKADQRVVNAEKKMRDLKRDAFESQKNWYQKSLMWAGRAVRLAVLSGYKVLGKLASAATIGGAVKRIPEQAIGAIYNKVFSSIAKKAPIEGSSMALNSELKWYKEFFNPKKFVRNSWDILKTGTTYLNKKMGKSEYEHIPILYAATDLHQIIKDPVKRATFEASFDNAMRYAAKEGLDVTDPLVIQSIENAAFKRANYEIFQESNALTRKFTAWKNEMEQKGNLGATAKFVADFFIPISSVPTNIARRVGITSPFGLLKANVDVINAYRKGMENLKPEEADMIMRQLKQGTLGTALWMIGWFGYASFGGLYTKFNPNKQRDDEDLASDKMEVGGVEIPKPTQHALPLEVIQSAATARRLWNKYNEDEEASKFGNIAKAGLASIGAVAEQVPIIETPVHMIMATQDPYEAKKLGEDIKNRVQPQILKETGIISKEDKEKRIFTEKEMESDKYKNLINAKLNIPKIGRRLSYDIKPDEAHPKGKMTVDEFNKFSDLVAKYSHDNTDYITTKYATQISKLKDLVSKESKDPKVLSEITVLSKAIESKLELAHKKAIEKARAELKFPTH